LAAAAAVLNGSLVGASARAGEAIAAAQHTGRIKAQRAAGLFCVRVN
jgi:hypothetical protein